MLILRVSNGFTSRLAKKEIFRHSLIKTHRHHSQLETIFEYPDYT